jgi:hypothetical protein
MTVPSGTYHSTGVRNGTQKKYGCYAAGVPSATCQFIQVVYGSKGQFLFAQVGAPVDGVSSANGLTCRITLAREGYWVTCLQSPSGPSERTFVP